MKIYIIAYLLFHHIPSTSHFSLFFPYLFDISDVAMQVTPSDNEDPCGIFLLLAARRRGTGGQSLPF